jgi:hypothetical protein
MRGEGVSQWRRRLTSRSSPCRSGSGALLFLQLNFASRVRGAMTSGGAPSWNSWWDPRDPRAASGMFQATRILPELT